MTDTITIYTIRDAPGGEVLGETSIPIEAAEASIIDGRWVTARTEAMP